MRLVTFITPPTITFNNKGIVYRWHPSIHFVPLMKFRVQGGTRAYPSCQWARGRVLLDPWRNCCCDYLVLYKLNLIELNRPPVYYKANTVEGSRSTQREPMQTRREHANSSQKCSGVDSGLSSYEATVLMLPHIVVIYLKKINIWISKIKI